MCQIAAPECLAKTYALFARNHILTQRFHAVEDGSLVLENVVVVFGQSFDAVDKLRVLVFDRSMGDSSREREKNDDEQVFIHGLCLFLTLQI